MKNVSLLLIAPFLFSCGGKEEKKEIQQTSEAAIYAEGAAADLTPSEQLGQELFDGKGNCFTCHKPDQKVIGPSVMEIAKMYKEKNGDMVKFLKEEADPIVDPANYSMMKPNFLITKNLTDEELKALEDYFYSHLKKYSVYSKQ